MNPFPFLDFSNYLGLIATGILTFNILLGMMLGTAYKKHNYWKRLPRRVKRIKMVDLHNWTAYAALLLVVFHPVLLLFDPSTKFKLPDIVFPIHAPHQALAVALGTVAMFAIITVIITTQKVIRKQISFRTWKNIHLVSYATAVLFIIHGIAMDPALKDRAIDFLDGEKLVSEFCGLLIIVATLVRYRYHLQTRKAK